VLNGTVAKIDLSSYLTSHQTMLYRPLKVNGVSKLTNTDSTALDLVAGSNITLTENGGAVTIDALDTTYSTATYNTSGLIKLGSDTQATQAVQTVTSTTGRQYAVQVNEDGRASVNVPWTDTTYTAGNGLDLTGTEFSVDNSVVAFQSDLPVGEVDITLNGTATQTTEILNNIVVDDKTYTLTSSRQTPVNGGTTLSLVNTGDMYAWNNKQDALTFDNVPTQNSNNPVKSSGVYTALNDKQDTLIAGNNITIENNIISSTTQAILNGVAYREIL
jgi:hypothetical protein